MRALILVATIFFIYTVICMADELPAKAPFSVPDESTIPAGPVGEAVKQGKLIFTQTQVYVKNYVGAKLNCSSCHLDAGTNQSAIPLVGVWGIFPEYQYRNNKVNVMQDRINACFSRSMNGKPLPYDSDEMKALMSYMWWLSRGVPTGVSIDGRGIKKIKYDKPVDMVYARKLFVMKCSICHGLNGNGKDGKNGEYLFPALWGDRSFNIGSGMARVKSLAGFIKANMPRGQGNTLSDEEAYNIAAYILSQPRPDYPGKENDWPKGNKPEDTPY